MIWRGLTLSRYFGKIQDKDEEYYMQFNLIICGLDSVEARRWINATLVNMVDSSRPESLKPLIDGGTEGASIATVSLVRSILIRRRLPWPGPRYPAYRVVLL